MHDGPEHSKQHRVRDTSGDRVSSPRDRTQRRDVHLHSYIADDAFSDRRLQELLQDLEAVEQRVGLMEVVRTAEATVGNGANPE